MRTAAPRSAPLAQHRSCCVRHGARAPRRAPPPARAAAGDKAGGGDALSWPDLRATGAPDADSHFDVSGVVVAPSFRASASFTAAQAAAAARGVDAGPVRVLFLSEGNVCRSVLAEALFAKHLAARDLQAAVQCESKGTRDYNVGEGPEPAAVIAAQALGAPLRADHVARISDFSADAVLFDVLLTVDKFTAADVMREVSIYDTIDPSGRYSVKVRSLTQFQRSGRRVDEIDDPLYGSTDAAGAESVAAVSAAAEVISKCCEGLADELAALVEGGAGGAGAPSLRAALAARLDGMTPMDWLKPPMLSKKK